MSILIDSTMKKVNGEKYYFADIDDGKIVDLRNDVIEGSVTIDDQGSRKVVIKKDDSIKNCFGLPIL